MNKNCMLTISTGFAAFLLLAACSSAESEFADAMRENSNVPGEVADCVAEIADKELSEAAREFLIASMRNDNQKAAEIRGDLSMAELTEAGLFMVSATTRCGAPIE